MRSMHEEQPPIAKLKAIRPPKLALLIVLAAILLGAGFAAYKLLPLHKNTSANPAPQAGSYISKTDHFAIMFRTKPVVNRTKSTPQQTTYETSANNGTAAFAVSVADYPNSYKLKSERAALQGIISSEAQNSPDGHVLSAKYITFRGKSALESSYRTVSNNTLYTVYSRVVLNNDKLYTISVIGASQADFTKFADTFVFVD